MKNRLILDTDGGVDDAQALMMLVGNGLAPDAITTVFGNVEMTQATTNILAVLATIGVEIPVYMGADRALVHPEIDAKDIHGEDGLGGAPRPDTIGTPETKHGVTYLVDTFLAAAEAGEKVDILLIGPLTNLALALRMAPGILAGIGKVVIMGGTNRGRGNVTPAAEFNIYCDPEAAQMVFAAELDILLVPWEVCMDHALSGEDLDRISTEIAASPVHDFAVALTNHERANMKRRGLPDGMLFVDPLAAAALIAPEMITETETGSIGVALANDIARGTTFVDPSGRLGTKVHTVLTKFDMAGLEALYARALTA